MNKSELIEHIAKSAGINNSQAKLALEAVESGVTQTLVEGGTVELKGFGTFKVIKKAQRNGRNPKTGVAIVIPATNAPTFKAGSKLKEAVNS